MIIFKKKFLIPLIVFLVFLFIYSLWGRMPDVDDAWIGEYAYWFAKDGHVHSELMRGINHQEELLVVHHKLFNLNGVLFIKAFGFSLYSLKAVSLFYFVIFLVLFYFYTRKWHKIFDKNDFLFALIILFSFPWIFKYSYLYRPEVMMMTLGFAGFILLENYIESEKKTIWKVLLSGMFFGWAMAAHLNGLIITAAGFFLLLWNRKYMAVLAYGVGVLAAFSVYFYDLTDMQAMDLWRDQFFNSPSLDSLNANIEWLKPVVNLLNEHMRYFHNPEIIVFSIFMFSALIIGFRFLYRHHTNLTRFAVLVALITGVLAAHKSRQYLLLNFPYLLILITLTIKGIKEKKIVHFAYGNLVLVRNLIVFLFLLFVTVSSYYNTMLALQKFSPEQNRKLAEKYAGGSEKEMNIIAPMTFIFNEVEYFRQIQGEICYVELQKNDSTIFGKGFLEKAYAFDRDLIMVTPYYQQKLGIESYKKGDEFEHYQVVDKNEEMIVLKRKTPAKAQTDRNDP